MKRVFFLLIVCSLLLCSCNDNNVYSVKGENNKSSYSSQEEYVLFVANLNSLKYHLPDCYLIAKTKEENKWETSDIELLHQRGFTPCKICMD